MNHQKKQVLFIGAGRMAQAMIKGIDKSTFIIVAGNNGNEARLGQVKEAFNVQVTSHWEEKIVSSDIIVLAMPPEVHDDILAKLSKIIHKQLIITVAAGIDPSYLESKLPTGTPTAWVMPNSAASIGQSMTLYALGQEVGDQEQTWLEALVEGMGAFEKVTEQQIHELTSLTASAPAFIYRIAEVFEKMVLESGVSKEQASKLLAHMIAGSSEMLQIKGNPRKLIDEVATPGGSTAAGLDVLEEKDIEGLLLDAIEACRKKARVDES